MVFIDCGEQKDTSASRESGDIFLLSMLEYSQIGTLWIVLLIKMLRILALAKVEDTDVCVGRS